MSPSEVTSPGSASQPLVSRSPARTFLSCSSPRASDLWDSTKLTAGPCLRNKADGAISEPASRVGTQGLMQRLTPPMPPPAAVSMLTQQPTWPASRASTQGSESVLRHTYLRSSSRLPPAPPPICLFPDREPEEVVTLCPSLKLLGSEGAGGGPGPGDVSQDPGRLQRVQADPHFTLLSHCGMMSRPPPSPFWKLDSSAPWL